MTISLLVSRHHGWWRLAVEELLQGAHWRKFGEQHVGRLDIAVDRVPLLVQESGPRRDCDVICM